MRRAWASLLLACLALAASCDRVDSQDETPDTAAAARSESELGWLEVALPATEIRTVDRLTVRVTLSRTAGATAGELEFDPGASGWTIAADPLPVQERTDDGSMRTRWVFELEPFLEGEYEVPGAAVDLQSPAGETAHLATTSQPVTVVSVLDESQDMVLAPPRPIATPPRSADGRPYWFAGALAGIVLLIGAAVVVSRRLGVPKDPPPESPAGAGTRDRARAHLGRLGERIAVLAGAPRTAPTVAELAPLVKRCPWIDDRDGLLDLLNALEAAAYGPEELPAADAAALEARADRVTARLDSSVPSDGGGS